MQGLFSKNPNSLVLQSFFLLKVSQTCKKSIYLFWIVNQNNKCMAIELLLAVQREQVALFWLSLNFYYAHLQWNNSDKKLVCAPNHDQRQTCVGKLQLQVLRWKFYVSFVLSGTHAYGI